VAAGPSGADADGGRDKGEAEQVLLDKAVKDSRHVFTPGRPRFPTTLPQAINAGLLKRHAPVRNY
jgi:hypothetical protein